MKFIGAFLIVALTVTVMAAAPPDGKWTGTVDTPNGPAPVSFTFLSDGTSLTGSTIGPDGVLVQIKNGMIDGDRISFVIDVDFGGTPITLAYRGVVTANQIELTLDFMGMPIEFVVKQTG